jgi:molybdopterin/thiamine biosynthesis adenylyltransferase
LEETLLFFVKIVSTKERKEEEKTKRTMWGEWMGSWKVAAASSSSSDAMQPPLDREAERIDRQKAAFGGDTLARIKDLNVLVIGCAGVGIETAKNCILSNVGAVVLYDPTIVTVADCGTNFYLHPEEHCQGGDGITRAEASLPHLQSLNPYCKVGLLDTATGDDDGSDSLWLVDWDVILSNPNVLNTGKPFACIVVTCWLPSAQLFKLNEYARQNHMAFIWAFTQGVTASIFSDFGQAVHTVTDPSGEPTQMLAIANIEVLPNKPSLLKIHDVPDGQPIIVVTVASNEHGLDDGDIVQLEDMRDQMQVLNGKRFLVRRVAFQSPRQAQIDTRDVTFLEILKQPTAQVIENFEKQYEYYRIQHEQQVFASNKTSMPVRTITMFNRLVLIQMDDNRNDSKEEDPVVGVSLQDVFAQYQSGGLLNQMRQPMTVHHRSLQETLAHCPVPQMLRGEDWENGKGIDIHIAIAAALEYYDTASAKASSSVPSWPKLHDEQDAQVFLEIAQKISDSRKNNISPENSDNNSTVGPCWSQTVSFGFPSGEPRPLDEIRLKRFAKLFATELTGFCAYLGGAAAQEVLKKTGKFTPISQWIHHDEQVLVTDECISNVQPLFGSRYDHQIAVLGKQFQARVSNQRVFLVGCGALGCEYLKGLALMGVGTGRDGHVTVTDMDRIEVSNLSRQFLFRDADVGSPKSVSGARVVKEWNPQMNITALEARVGVESEDLFDDKFWSSLSVCWNALDNVLARKYTDSRCLFFSKPLLESGTLGTKCNHEVILPYRTSTYNDGKESDENENQIAMCTLRSFPYLPLHCIEYAKQAYFLDYFSFAPDQYETFRKDKTSFFEQLETMEPGEQFKSLSMIDYFIKLQTEDADGRIDFAACVQMAFDRMIKDFRTSILNLCYAAEQMEISENKPFWTGTKRRPRAVVWDSETVTPELMEYLYCTANLYAVVFGVEPVRDRGSFEKIVMSQKLRQPEWSPSTDSKVDLSEDDNGGETGDEAALAEKLKAELYSIDTSSLQPAYAHEFEKDDDSNFHIDFLTVATNLRAWNYDIKQSQRHAVKVTAGRIIPALATTTACKLKKNKCRKFFDRSKSYLISLFFFQQ